MSEAYHSSYVTTGSTGMKLVDAAYKDITLALTSKDEASKRKRSTASSLSSESKHERSKSFLQSLKKAKEDAKHVKLVKNVSSGPTAMKFTILGKQTKYVVDICRSVGCSCSFFAQSSTSRKKVSCKHIIWVLMNVLQVPEKSNLLQQVFQTDKELKNILTRVEEHHEPSTGSNDTTQLSRLLASPSVFLTNVEMESIFKAKQSTQPQQV